MSGLNSTLATGLHGFNSFQSGSLAAMEKLILLREFSLNGLLGGFISRKLVLFSPGEWVSCDISFLESS